MSNAWRISRDFLASKDEPSDVGLCGPSDAPQALLDRLGKGQGVTFRLYDDDGEHYYTGRVIALNDDGTDQSYPECGEEFFGPLWDYGTPGAGCTEIRYRNTETRKWETL